MRGLRAGVGKGGCTLLLWAASWLVPRPMRGEWMREWRAEAWYARRLYVDQGERRAELLLLRFCAGAWKDAWSLRATREVAEVGFSLERGSAKECVLVSLAILSISVGIGLLLPHVRAKLWPSFPGNTEALMVIEKTTAAERGIRTLPASQYLTWRNQRQRIFESFAFYEVREQVLRGMDRQGRARVAYATGNVLDVLNDRHSGPVPVGRSGLKQEVVLSRELWRAYTEGLVDGHAPIVQIGGDRYAVAGEAPAAASSLPGHPDVWILDAKGREPEGASGFILGRLNPSFHENFWGDRWAMSAPQPDGSSSDFTCISLGQALRQPWEVCGFAILLALLTLPATTSLPLGEYPSRAERSSRGNDVKRWGFLLGKMGLVLSVVYWTSMDLAYANSHLTVNHAEYIQLLSSFVLCLLGMRWSLRDQRQRCPVCLSKLTHPARVGQPSWSFLAWNGTELICAGGHGVLHVPELATSWFRTQRWLALDGSWQVLFTPSPAGIGAP